MQKVKVYNNLVRKKVEFETVEENKVRFYSCGPTTYDFLHVGNARAFVVGDLIHRIFRTLGYEVNFVRNFTDVDDKIIKRAQETGVDALEHSRGFVEECKKDMRSLGMLDPTHAPLVSETMDEIISMVKELVDKGYAYEAGGDVLYHVPKFDEYGKLSKKDLENLEHGKRVSVEDHKKHPSDFVLWKSAKEGEPSWPSPWGEGRPGWHIECSAMARKFLGNTIDLHHGGVDLMFPHHENEIAQSEAANGKEFCTHWCHNEFLNFGSEKMSKSLGNVVTIRQFVETYGGEVLRQLLTSVHYRSRMDWGDDAIKKAIGDIERIHKFLLSFEQAKKENMAEETEIHKSIFGALKKISFDLANDFNVPGAMGHFFALVRTMNREYLDEQGDFSSKKKMSPELVKLVDEVVEFVGNATGLIHDKPAEMLEKLKKAKSALKGGETLSSEEIEAMIIKRNEARSTKNWAVADEMRNKLSEAGVQIKDNPDGTTSWTLD